MRYIGSKVSVVDDLFEAVSSRVPSGTFCDPFGGIGVVGAHFKSKGYAVRTGDILRFAHCFQITRIRLSRMPRFLRLRTELGFSNHLDVEQHLNDLPPRQGWLVREFARRRRFFIPRNAAKIQACRCCINGWRRKGWLSHNEYAFLIASLINSFDRVANTAGTYYAYLKSWNRKALKPFHFEFMVPTLGAQPCVALNCDALTLLKRDKYDVVYLDPPYNERDYSGYYHLPETIARAITPKATGMSGIAARRTKRSAFNSRESAANALKALVQNVRCKVLAFHYSDAGLIPRSYIRRVLGQAGRLEECVLEAKGYTTKSSTRTTKHRLYLVTYA